MDLKFYTSVVKELKLKVRKFWGPIPTFAEVTEGKLVGWAFPPILIRAKINFKFYDVTTWLTNNGNTHIAHIKGSQTMKFG